MDNSQINYEKLIPYIPRTILNWYRQSGEDEIHLVSEHEGGIVCIDASGFTALTRQLASHGKEGPEILTRVLNLFFDAMASVIFRYSGDVLKFAGDALWAYFPRFPHAGNLFGDILRALEEVNSCDELTGRTQLKVHLGAEMGKFHLASLGDPAVRLEAEPVGNLLGVVYRACDTADDNEFAVGPTLAAHCGDTNKLSPINRELSLVAPSDTGDSVKANIVGPQAGRLTHNGDILKLYIAQDVLTKIETSAPSMSVQGEHRQVVVLFANFESNIGRKGDNPVQAVRVMNDKLRLCFEFIHDFHGSIARIDPFNRGHKLLVLFGAPTKREDDEISALLCARKLTGLVDDSFRIRTGLAIGPLFCGDVGAESRREYTVMGDGINFAARLMAKADWSEIMIDPSLRSRLPGEIETDPITLELKGIGDRVTCHKFSGVSESSSSSDIAANIIGQDYHRTALDAAWNRTRGGQKQLVAIAGTTGIGKSTLLNSFSGQLTDAKPVKLEGKNSRLFGRAWLSKKLIRSLMDRNGLLKDTRLDDFMAGRVEARWLPLLGELLETTVEENEWTSGLTPELRAAKTREMIQIVVEALIVSPQMVIVDDFDQADGLFHNLVQAVVESTQDCPLMLVVASRPDKTGLPQKASEAFEIYHLEAPSESDWRGYFDEHFGPGVREKELFERILKASKGNPHFITQFLSQCLSEHKLVTNSVTGKWELAEAGLEITVPDNLMNLQMSVFDSLPEVERTILKVASVAVGEFTAELISGAERALGIEEITDHLNRLTEAGLLHRDETGESFSFTHTSMREAVYRCVPESQLRRLHGLYAEVIRQADPENNASLLAHHYYRAAILKDGFEYSLKAAEQAFKSYALTDSAEYFGQCQDILKQEPPDESDSITMVLQFYSRFASFLKLEGRYSEAYAALRDCRRLGKRHGRTHECLMAAIDAASLLWAQSKYRRCRKVLDSVIESSERHGDQSATAKALSLLSNLERRTGDFARAQNAGQQATEIARRIGDNEILAEAQTRLGLAYWSGGKLSEAVEVYNEAITTDADNIRRKALSSNNMGLIQWERGFFVEAEKLFTTSVDILRSIGDKRNESYLLGNLGGLSHIFGKLTRAEECYLQADLIFNRLDDRHAHIYAVGNLGDLDLARGDMESAEQRFNRVIEFAKEVDDKELIAECEVRFGELAFFRGNVIEARQRYQDAIVIAEEIGSTEYLTRACVGLARLLIGERDHADAQKVIERISKLAAENKNILAENEAVFLTGEHHRIKNESGKATPCYRKTLSYSQREQLFELSLKSAVRLYETDPESKQEASRVIRDLREYFIKHNSNPAWDQLMRSSYYSYFAETLAEILPHRSLTLSPRL